MHFGAVFITWGHLKSFRVILKPLLGFWMHVLTSSTDCHYWLHHLIACCRLFWRLPDPTWGIRPTFQCTWSRDDECDMNLVVRKRFVRSLIPTCPSTKTDDQVEIVFRCPERVFERSEKRVRRTKRELVRSMFGTNPNSLTLFNLNKTALDKNLKHLVQSLLIKTLTKKTRSIYTIIKLAVFRCTSMNVFNIMYVYKSTTAAFKNLQDKI